MKILRAALIHEEGCLLLHMGPSFHHLSSDGRVCLLTSSFPWSGTEVPSTRGLLLCWFFSEPLGLLGTSDIPSLAELDTPHLQWGSALGT